MSALSDVVVRITANINEFRNNLQDAQNRLDEFGNRVSRTSANFATVGKVAGIAGAAVATGLGFAVKTAADFDSEMSKVKALSGATQEEFNALRDAAIDLGSKSVYSASEAAEGMSILAAAGLDSQQVIAAMPGLLDAAAASGEDFANVSDIMVSSMSGFGLQAKDMGHIADVLASAANASSISISDIGYSLKYVAPVAKSAGMSIEEVSSALAVLGNSGIKADQAGTSLRMALSRLVAPPKEAAEMIQALGISVTDFQGNVRPLSDIIGQLSTKFKDLDQQQRLEAASTIFGAESMSSMLTLIDAGPDKLDQMTQSFKSADGAANTMAQTMTDNLNGSLEQLKGAAESALISIGSALSPALRTVADGVQALVGAFNSLPGPVKNTIAIVTAITAVVTLLAAGVFLIIGFIPAIVGGFAALAGMGVTVAGAFTFLLTTVLPIVAAIAAVIAIGVLLYTHWDEIKAFTFATWQAISDFVVGIWTGIENFLTSTWQAIKDGANTFIEGVKAIFVAGFEFISSTVSSIWSKIDGVFKAYTGTIQALITAWWDVLKTITATVFLAIYYIITGQWGKVGEVFSSATQKLQGIVDTFWSTVKQLWTDAFNQLKNTATDIWNRIETLWNNSLTALKNAWTSSWNSIWQTLQNAWNSIFDLFISAPGRIADAMRRIADGVRNTFSSMSDSAYSAGKDLIWGFIEGVGVMAGALANKVRNVVSGAVDSAKRALGIQSPSKVFKAIGINTVKGFALGLDKTSTLAVKAASGMVDGVTAAVDGMTFDPGSLAVGAGAGAAAGGGPSITVGQLVVREEADINRIAEQLYRLHKRGQRAKGAF